MKLDTKWEKKIKKKIRKQFFFRKKKKLEKKIKFFFLEKWKKVKKIMRENALFFYQKTRNCKTRKIEKIEFFCAYCVHTQNFLGDNSLMLCCSPKNFSWFFETFLVLKILAKKNIFRKKGSTTEISEKKKKIKNDRFSPIGRNMDPIFGGSIFGY